MEGPNSRRIRRSSHPPMIQATEELIGQEVRVFWRERRALALRKGSPATRGFSPGPFSPPYGLVEFKIALTGAGSSLSAFFNSKLTCHICVSDRTCEYEGIPERRIPFATFQ
jgi:hypothetical protein